MRAVPGRRHRALAIAALALAAVAAAMPTGAATAAQRPAADVAAAERLPAEVARILKAQQVPREALAVLVQPVQEAGQAPAPRLAVNTLALVNPASLFKLVTTSAALDLLGPAFTWTTPVWLQGPVRDGVLDGSVTIQGRGDPKLVVERLWLLLRRVQALGVREIRGDIVLDQSAFAVPAGSPGEFDNEPSRPYNARPEALLLNQKAVVYTFTPDAARGIALVSAEPPQAGVLVDASVPLGAGPCDDWRAALKASLADPARVRFTGAYPSSCGERSWPLAPEPKGYAARVVEAMWRELGGSLGGSVREGAAPVGVRPIFELASPPLADVVRDINKFSNNVMAQQLFLTLALQRQGRGTPEGARAVLQQWLVERLGPLEPGTVIDNGSGLSRDTRVTVALFGRLLQAAWAGPSMPELMASLPVSGLDGTLRKSTAGAGRAHLKTGSLRDVVGIAGYVLGTSGRRYLVVAIVNHPNANAARPALDAVVQWAIDDGGR